MQEGSYVVSVPQTHLQPEEQCWTLPSIFGGVLARSGGSGGQHLVPGQVHGEATAWPPPHGVDIRLPQVRPETPKFIAVPGEVKDAVG